MCNKQFLSDINRDNYNNGINQSETKVVDTVNVLDENIIRIFEFSKEKVDEILKRKQHIETKTLYLLQATTIVATLIGTISGDSSIFKIIDSIKKSNFNFDISITLAVIAYIIMIFSIGILVLSLKDTLLCWKATRYIMKKFFNYNINKELKLTDLVNEKIAKAVSDKGRNLNSEELYDIEASTYSKENYYYKDIGNPHDLLLVYSNEYSENPNAFYIKFIEKLNLTVVSGRVINIVKDKFFSTGLYLYVIAVTIILINEIIL